METAKFFGSDGHGPTHFSRLNTASSLNDGTHPGGALSDYHISVLPTDGGDGLKMSQLELLCSFWGAKVPMDKQWSTDAETNSDECHNLILVPDSFNMDDYTQRQALLKYFPDNAPARATVGTTLMVSGARIEIEAIAYHPLISDNLNHK